MDDKIITKWDAGTLNRCIGLIFKNSPSITVANLRNLQRLFQSCDFSIYRTKGVIIRRVEFIMKALYAKLDEGLEDESLVLNYCRPINNDPIIDDIINNVPRYKQINHKEINFLNRYVEDRLQFGIVQTKLNVMRDLIQKVDDDEFGTLSQVNQSVDEWIADYNNTLRNVRLAREVHVLDFNNPNFIDDVRDIVKRLNTRSSTMCTGIQMLNSMLGGGYHPEKLYVYLGFPGGFKSAILLKAVLDGIRYNAKSYQPREPGLVPTVLYITLENTKDVTLARTYNSTVSGDRIENHTPEEILEDLKKARIVQNDDMGLYVMYRTDKSITPDDIRLIIDDLKSQGKEVCMVSVDYLKRLRPVHRGKDEKEELKNVTNELRAVAIDYHIPIISAQQLNRSGMQIVKAAERNGESDLARLLGPENISTAIEIQENADMTIILNIERRRSDGRLFLTFYRVKDRDGNTPAEFEYFNQPFYEDNEFMLIDDILMSQPQGVTSLMSDMDSTNADLKFNVAGKKHSRDMVKESFETDDYFNLTPLSGGIQAVLP